MESSGSQRFCFTLRIDHGIRKYRTDGKTESRFSPQSCQQMRVHQRRELFLIVMPSSSSLFYLSRPPRKLVRIDKSGIISMDRPTKIASLSHPIPLKAPFPPRLVSPPTAAPRGSFSSSPLYLWGILGGGCLSDSVLHALLRARGRPKLSVGGGRFRTQRENLSHDNSERASSSLLPAWQ